MPPAKPVTEFKGPGHWRSQADDARSEAGIFGQLADAARRLQDKGLGDAQQAVHRAEAALQAEDHETAGGELRAAARLCQQQAPAYAAGLRALAEQVEEAAPPSSPAPPPGRQDPDDTTEHHPAMED